MLDFWQQKLRTSHRNPGVTLIELTIVLLIMVLLTLVAAPTFHNSISFRRVEASAQRIKADLELVKQFARETGSPATVSFEVAEEKYQVPPLQGLAAGAASKTVVDFGSDPYRCDIQTAVIGGKPWVTFDRFGLPHAAGGITLQAGSHNRLVSINGATGEIKILGGISDAELDGKAEADGTTELESDGTVESESGGINGLEPLDPTGSVLGGTSGFEPIDPVGSETSGTTGLEPLDPGTSGTTGLETAGTTVPASTGEAGPEALDPVDSEPVDSTAPETGGTSAPESSGTSGAQAIGVQNGI